MEYRVYEPQLGAYARGRERIFTDLDKAKAEFERVKSQTNTEVFLQTLHPVYKWAEELLDHFEAAGWKERQERYWKMREANDESELWHAGDSPWTAPGMRVADFI